MNRLKEKEKVEDDSKSNCIQQKRIFKWLEAFKVFEFNFRGRIPV